MWGGSVAQPPGGGAAPRISPQRTRGAPVSVPLRLVARLERPPLDRQAARVRGLRARGKPARPPRSAPPVLAAVRLQASIERQGAGRALRRDRARRTHQGRSPPLAVG